jgi:Holliday junction resolvase
MMVNKNRQKGDRIERNIVKAHKEWGFKTEKVPLSGSLGYRGNIGDVDIYLFGHDKEHVVSEVKGRKN